MMKRITKAQGKPIRLRPQLRTLTVAQWITMRDNPRQRDTVARARKAWWLSEETLEPHREVHMAVLPDGTEYKIDGHTRAYLWSTGEAMPPDEVLAVVYDCATIEDVVDLYMMFDAAEAADSITDLLFGLAREQDVHFQSELLASFKFAAAMAMAQDAVFGPGSYKRRYLKTIFGNWLKQLRLVDAVAPTHNAFPAPVLTGGLLILRKNEAEAVPFLQAYQSNSGTKGGGKMDGVQALFEYIAHVRLLHQFWGARMRNEIIRSVIGTFEGWRENRSYDVKRLTDGSPQSVAMFDRSFRKWLVDIRPPE